MKRGQEVEELPILKEALSLRKYSESAIQPYVYFVVHLGRLDAFAAAGSDHSIKIIEGTNAQSLYTHADTITCMKYLEARNTLLTSSLDGVIALFALNEQFAIRQTESPRALRAKGKAGYLWFDVDPEQKILAACTDFFGDEAGIDLYDIASGQLQCSYNQSHSDAITQCAFHFHKSSTLLSAGTDGLLVLYDTEIEDEDDSVLCVMNSGSSIQRAGFLERLDIIYALSDMHTLTLWSLDGDCLHDTGDLRSMLFWPEKWQTHYVIDVYSHEGFFSPHYSPSRADQVLLFAGNNSGAIAVVAVDRTREERPKLLTILTPSSNTSLCNLDDTDTNIVRSLSIKLNVEDTPLKSRHHGAEIVAGTENGLLCTWHFDLTPGHLGEISSKRSRLIPSTDGP